MSNSNNKSKKRYNQESIDTASRMSENITLSPSPSKKSTPSPSKKNNKNYENLLNKLERTGIKGTPSPVKKPTRSTSSGSIPKVRSSILKSESNTSEENISIAQTKSKSNSNSNSESGKNISFNSTKKTQVTAKNISFNSTKATQKSSKKKTVSRASTEASSKPKPKPKSVKSNSKPKKESNHHGKLIRHVKNAIQKLKNKQNTQPMPKSVYLRDIKTLQEQVGKLEEQKKMINSIGFAPNTNTNTNTNTNSNSKSKSGSSSLRSYTSQEASFQKGRNAQKSFSPMSINKSKSSPYSMMSINGSMVGSTKSKSSPPGTVRRSLLGEMSRVLNLSANRNSREAENVSSKKKSKKKSKKRSDK
jgi:hypothetical protein